MIRKWTPLHFGEYKGKTLPWIFRHHRDWFFWAYEEEFFYEEPLEKEASEIYCANKRSCQEKTVGCKIKELFHYGMITDPALKKPVTDQLKLAIQVLAKCPKNKLKDVKKTLRYQYLLLYVIHESPFLYEIGNKSYDYNKLVDLLALRKGVRQQSVNSLKTAFRKVRFDLYNYRTAVIDGKNVSDSKGITLLKKIIEDKKRKGIRCPNRTLRSLQDSLRGKGAPKFILERLKWEKGKAKTTFAPGRLIFIPKKTM